MCFWRTPRGFAKKDQTFLRGLSHEMDLAFDDMHGQFKAQIGDAASC
jgi:hypothetical protein